MTYQVQQLITWGEAYFPHWVTIATYGDPEAAETHCRRENRAWDASFRVVSAEA